MAKSTRPTEDSAFSDDVAKAGRLLCERLGMKYCPATALYYAEKMQGGEWDLLPFPFRGNALPGKLLRKSLSEQIDILLG